MVCALGVAAWLLVYFWVVSGHKRVGAKEIPLASAEEWRPSSSRSTVGVSSRAGWKMKKRKTGAWPSAKGPCGPPPTPFCSVARHDWNARLPAFRNNVIVTVSSRTVVWLWALRVWLARNRLQI